MRLFIRRISLICLFLLLLASAIAAKTIEMPEAGVEFKIPETWSIEAVGPNWYVKSPDGGSVAMVFAVLENPDLEAAVQESEKAINEAVGQLSLIGDIVEGELNGLKFIEQQATAMDGQISVSLSLALTPTQKWLQVAYFGAAEKEAAWEKDVESIAASLRPIEKSGAKAATADSFALPFSSEKALSLLFGPLSPQGEVKWQPDPKTFAALNEAEGQALSRAIAYKEYENDESQILFLYKSAFPINSEPFNQTFIGAAIFSCENGVCKTVYNNPALIQFGSYETETRVRFVKIGQHRHGALVEGGDTHQGITVTNAVLLAVQENRVTLAAQNLPVYEDNHGATDDANKLYQFSTSIYFEPGAHSHYYNMKVKFSGTTLETIEQDGKVAEKVVPASFTRAFFWNDEGFYEEEIECGNE